MNPSASQEQWTWKSKAALASGLCAPLAVIGLSDPAAADPGSYDTLEDHANQSGSDPTGGATEATHTDVFSPGFGNEAFENYSDNVFEQPDTALGQADYGGFFIEPDGDGDGDGDMAEQPEFVDEYSVRGRYAVDSNAETDNQPTYEEFGRDFFVPDEAGQSPSVTNLMTLRQLELLDIEPGDAYTLRPGTHGWQIGLDAAAALKELELPRDAENVIRNLEDAKITGYYKRPEGQTEGGTTLANQAVVYTAGPVPELILGITHESSHITQFESASPVDEIEAFSKGWLTTRWLTDEPEHLTDDIELTSVSLVITYPEFARFAASDIQSHLATEIGKLLPETLPDNWERARTELETQVIDLTVTEDHIREYLDPDPSQPVRYETHPDDSVTFESEHGDTTMRINPNGSITIGHSSEDPYGYVETHRYNNQIIGSTFFEYDTGHTHTKNQLGRWTNLLLQDGTAIHTTYPVGEPSRRVTAGPGIVGPEGDFLLQQEQ